MRPTQEWLTKPDGLADALRSIREAVRPRLTAEELAQRAGWTRTKVSKLQNGQQMPAPEDIETWCQMSGRPEEVPRLLKLLEEAQTVHRQFRHQLHRGGHAAVQVDLDRLVRQAAVIRDVEITLIPGLLQTPEYAAYPLQQAMWITGDNSDVDTAVRNRMRRQEILYEGGREFEFIIMETALRLRMAPNAVMLGQLDRLQAATGLPGVAIRIIPSSRLVPVMPIVPFLQLDDMTYVETHTSEDLLRGEESARYSRIADRLRESSVTGNEARFLISGNARRFEA